MYDLTTIAQQAEARPTKATERQPVRTPASLVAMIERVSEAIESETAGIRKGGDFDVKASNARKSRHLYELSKAFKAVGDMKLMTGHAEALRLLRDRLAANERAILAHMNAVSEIAGLLQTAIQNAEADGTYSANGYAVADAG
jgi:hypothetical protein